MKKTLCLLTVLLLVAVVPAFADIVQNEEVIFGTIITPAERQVMLAEKGVNAAKTALQLVPARKDEGVFILSECVSSSSYITQSRANMMAWMVGAVSIPTDRTANPAACYQIPEFGLQWFDYLNTGFKSWLGTTMFQSQNVTNENGHRIIVSCAGQFPVSNYWCHITSTSTNIGLDYLFPVDLVSGTTNEIPFNLNFVGINFGADGVLQSYYDTTLGHWVQAGDDTVYVNGEYPSHVPYTWWYRINATVQKIVALPGDVKPIKDEFVSGVQSMTAQLVKPNGEGYNVVSSQTVTEAQANLNIINLDASQVQLKINGGQVGIPYEVLTTTNLAGSPIVWTMLFQNQPLNTGSSWNLLKPDFQRYYRLRGVSP